MWDSTTQSAFPNFSSERRWLAAASSPIPAGTEARGAAGPADGTATTRGTPSFVVEERDDHPPAEDQGIECLSQDMGSTWRAVARRR